MSEPAPSADDLHILRGAALEMSAAPMMENQSEQKMSMKRKPWVPLKAYIYIWIYERYGGEPNGKENGRCDRHGASTIIRLFRVGVMGSGRLPAEGTWLQAFASNQQVFQQGRKVRSSAIPPGPKALASNQKGFRV